jgi:hypothetical protein
LEKKLIIQYKSLGWVENEFGYCLYPSSEHKTLNSLIQSTVAGEVDLLSYLFFTKCPEAEYVVNTHDEITFQVPIERKEEIKKIYYECVDELNRMLSWSVKINFEWAESDTWWFNK